MAEAMLPTEDALTAVNMPTRALQQEHVLLPLQETVVQQL